MVKNHQVKKAPIKAYTESGTNAASQTSLVKSAVAFIMATAN